MDVLSRGTREQLFLSIRMAVVATFGRRGVKLPMVLDDVLVNFDEHRARRAAEVLCKFAAGGHQLLVFTCHEHMWQMFQNQDADCRRLPNRLGTAPAAPAPKPVVEKKVEAPKPAPTPKKRELPKRPIKVVEKVVEEVPVVLEPEPIAVYEYPFVEKFETTVVQQPAEKIAVGATVIGRDDDLEGLEYSFGDSPGEVYAGREETLFYDKTYRDHLRPRRA